MIRQLREPRCRMCGRREIYEVEFFECFGREVLSCIKMIGTEPILRHHMLCLTEHRVLDKYSATIYEMQDSA
jgi:hypothetical protein